MGKGSGWSILGRAKPEVSAPVSPAPTPAAPAPPTPPLTLDRRDLDHLDVETALARLPTYYTTTDLIEAFHGKDPLLDAYVAGYLTPVAEGTLEANYPQLSCWLLARLLREIHAS